MQVNGTVCLAFYYHMWGYHMGALEVFVNCQYVRLVVDPLRIGG